ncbi:MAG: hypothetical protein ACI9OJ_004466 [Myxococcota bacterium]|jgi:hypothetical protein
MSVSGRHHENSKNDEAEMRLELPTAVEAAPILRAFQTVARASSAVDERQAAMIQSARVVLGADLPSEPLTPITPEELAGAVTRPAVRSQLIQGMVVLSLLDEEAEPGELAEIQSFATALDVAPDELKNLRQIVEENTMALRLDVARRIWLVDRLKQAWAEGGFRWLVRSMATLKLMDDNSVADRYRALADYPEGSLGRTYYDHMREVGFPLPGEKGSQVEAVFIHDLTHLVSGYGTDATGEVLTAAFSAGNRGKDPFTYIFFVLCQFHLGKSFSPFAPTATGEFDAAAAIWATRRGMEVNVDMTETWDYWPDLELPVEDVRVRLGMTLPLAGS